MRSHRSARQVRAHLLDRRARLVRLAKHGVEDLLEGGNEVRALVAETLNIPARRQGRPRLSPVRGGSCERGLRQPRSVRGGLRVLRLNAPAECASVERPPPEELRNCGARVCDVSDRCWYAWSARSQRRACNRMVRRPPRRPTAKGGREALPSVRRRARIASISAIAGAAVRTSWRRLTLMAGRAQR